MDAAKTYVAQLANDQTKLTMSEFFSSIHARFYPNQDISFMKYFLELTDHEDQFIVHHNKLREYGIMTSTQSSDAKKKFDTLLLIEGIDYRVRDVSDPVQQGGVATAKHYYLTPEAFKTCLLRAQRRANQPIDPIIYSNYYILLEKVFRLYMLYELLSAEKKIDNLRKNNASLSDEIVDLLDTITDMNDIDLGSPRCTSREGSDDEDW